MNDRPMGTNVDDVLIQDGWDVHSADDHKVGNIYEAHPDYLLVQKGFLFKKDIYIPVAEVESTDPEQGRVYLRTMKDQIDNMAWDTPPAATAATTTTAASTAAYAEPAYGRTDSSEVHLREEQLQARTREVEAGQVEVGKRVVSEQQTLNVPVTHEEVQIEHHSVSPRPAEGAIGEGETIRVPLSREEVEVEKRPVVTEEIEVHKTAVTENRQVNETVRREEPVIEGANTNVAGAGGTGSREQVHEHRFENGVCSDCGGSEKY